MILPGRVRPPRPNRGRRSISTCGRRAAGKAACLPARAYHKKRHWEAAAFIIFFAALAVCLALLVARAVAEDRNDRLVSSLQSQVASSLRTEAAVLHAPATSCAETCTPLSGTAEHSPSPESPYASLVAQNGDFIGWLRIEGTEIDYPVLFRPGDPEYYIDRNFNGEPDTNGSLFLDGKCTPDGENLLIHGHNMKSGKMFGQLDKYKDRSFFLQHPDIEFNTLEGRGTYEIVAVFLSKVYYKNEKAFKYYNATDLNSKEAFDSYLENIRKLALYDTGTDARYGDRLITLSTCAYHTKNGRLVVVARQPQ